MKQRNRAAILKLLVFSLLFLQFTLSFHTHSPEESLHCDACVTTHHADHESQADEECWIGTFFHANLASATLPAAETVIQVLPSPCVRYREEQIILTAHRLPLGSRAPPSFTA